ncbi:MAG: NADH-quinone oxidoreductase subunit NuoI [Desulfurococcales archaeon]|nr:NADH-quinone oxidoreductase subunit NuoI [Desulfurococcales archaeon]
MPARPVLKELPKRGGLFHSIRANIAALSIGLKYFVNPQRMTLIYPKEYIKLDPLYRGFIVLEKKKCINCSSCARICPAAAMKMISIPEPDPKHPGKVRAKLWPVINYQRCIFCGYCVDVCPTEALYHLPYHDIVYENLAEMDWDLETFSRPPRYPTEEEGRPVTYLIDERQGLVKVPSEESRG